MSALRTAPTPGARRLLIGSFLWPGLSLARRHFDVEVQDILAGPEAGVERDGRIVTQVRLDINGVCAPHGGNTSQLLDQRRGNTLATVRLQHGQVIEVDLAALLLELRQLVGGETAHHHTVPHRRQRNEVVAAEQPLEMGIPGRRLAEGIHFFEGLTERDQERAHQREIGWGDLADCRPATIAAAAAFGYFDSHGMGTVTACGRTDHPPRLQVTESTRSAPDARYRSSVPCPPRTTSR